MEWWRSVGGKCHLWRTTGGDGVKRHRVIFMVDEGLRTLMDFRDQRQFEAREENMAAIRHHDKGARYGCKSTTETV